MDEEIRRAQELLEERRRNLGIDPKTGRRPEPKNISENLNALMQSQQSGSLAPAGRVSLRCSKCGEVFTLPKGSETRATVGENLFCYEHKREEEIRIAQESRKRERVAYLAENIDTELARIGILWEHHMAALIDFPKAVSERAILALDEPEQFRGLLVTGSVGSGKTRLLAALARRGILEGNHQVRFILARKFFRRIWATYREGAPETEEEVIADYSSCDVLLIDDLAHEGRVSEAGIGALHEVITVRNGNYLPTAVSTNLTLDEIAQHYDASIASRLAAWLPVVLNGVDRRKA